MTAPKQTQEQIDEHLARLSNWTLNGSEITRQFEFKDFIQSMQFVNQLAEAAESLNHHPDIDIRYNRVGIALTTHDAGGLTAADFDLASVADDFASAVIG